MSSCKEPSATITSNITPPTPSSKIIQQEHPNHWLHGLPVLNNDLAWPSVEAGKAQSTALLFMTEGIAAPRLLIPGGAKLEVARTRAERLAWGIQTAIGTDLSKFDQLA